MFAVSEKISVGLDIGNCRINMVKMASEPTGLRLLDFASISVNPRQSRRERLGQLIKIVQEKGVASFPVNVGVSGESVIVRYIELPKMKREEVGQALKYEAQQYIPFKMEQVIFDFHVLEPLPSDRNKMKVLLVAVKRQAIMELVELIRGAGVKPRIVDVNSFSLINCFQKNGPGVGKDDVFALINLEFDLVNINILQGETPFFTRDISLLEDILSFRGQQESGEKVLFEAMRPLLANLIREICISIDYFESEFEKQVYAIYLSGAGARIPELKDSFTSQLGREINLWNPVQNLLIDFNQTDTDTLKQTSCMLAMACGLALR